MIIDAHAHLDLEEITGEDYIRLMDASGVNKVVLLASVSSAWDKADQEQRNRIAQTLFEEILVEDRKVVAVRPRPELEPVFKLNLECHSKDIACDPDGIPVR